MIALKILKDVRKKITNGGFKATFGGQHMGKVIRTEYYCDRCGKLIIGTPCTVGRFKYLHIFKWYVPEPCPSYPLRYMCQDCFNAFKKWYEENKK